MEPRCPAGSGRRDALIRPRAIFAARRVRNPGLGRLLGRLGKLREGKSGRLGRRVARSRDAASLRPLRAASAAEGWGRAPRAEDAAPEPIRPAPRAPSPARSLTAAAGTGASGVLRASGRGCRRRPEGTRAESPPARPGMPWSEGRARRGRARPEGAAALTQGSGMRAARPARVTSSGRAAGTPAAGGRKRLGRGGRTWWPSWTEPDGQRQPLPDSE